ncbi:30S ribosomal protein S6e [uncultured archaeon]|nr:30S ribosomal protein S6e [uncultured archaeon]
MVFKINIAGKNGKTYHLESDSEEFIGKELHNKIEGKEFNPELNGYEFEITGTSDSAGFTSLESVEGSALKKVLLGYGKAMHKRSRREGKKKVSNFKPKGLRMRKTVRGKVISPAIVQINLKILKEGSKKLDEIFPEQNKPKEKPEAKAEEKPAE